MIKQKISAILLALALCLSMLPATAMAAGNVSFELSGNVQSVKAEDNVILTLSISNKSGEAKTVGACQVVLLYDASAFEPVATGTTPFKNNCYTVKETTVDEEELSLNPTVGINTPGVISVAFAGSDSYTIPNGETMTLLRLNLRVKEEASAGSTAITFDANSTYRAFDAQGVAIPGVTLGDGVALTVQGVHTHSYGTPEWSWTGYAAATAKFTCACGDVQSVQAEITDAVTTPATAETTGVRTYTATASFGGEEYTDTKIEQIPMTSVYDLGEKSGDTVTMTENISMPDSVYSVPAGETLDLAGHTLTVKTLIVPEGAVIRDGGQPMPKLLMAKKSVGGGKLYGTLTVSGDNGGVLPVRDADGAYSFYELGKAFPEGTAYEGEGDAAGQLAFVFDCATAMQDRLAAWLTVDSDLTLTISGEILSTEEFKFNDGVQKFKSEAEDEQFCVRYDMDVTAAVKASQDAIANVFALFGNLDEKVSGISATAKLSSANGFLVSSKRLTWGGMPSVDELASRFGVNWKGWNE